MPFDPKAYLASKTQAPAPSVPKAFDPKAYLASKTQVAQNEPQIAPQESEEPENPGVLDAIKDYGVAGLQWVGDKYQKYVDPYSGAPVRAGIYALQNNMGDPGAAVSAVKNQFGADASTAPTGKDIARRAGVPDTSLSDVVPSIYSENGKGWSLKKGGLLDPTASGVAGFAADVATDPLTYAGGLLSSAGKAEDAGKAVKNLNKVVNPIETLTEPTGKAIYKSGLKRIDQEVAKYGKEPVSDVLLEHGVTGSADSIHKQMDALGEALYQKRQGLLKESTKRGGEVSMKEAMAPALAKIEEIRLSKNPALQPVADALQSDVNKYLALDAKKAEPMLRELPVSSEFKPSYSEVQINPRDWKLGSLPKPAETESSFYKYPKGEMPGTVGIYSTTGGKRIPVAPEMTIEETPRVVPGKTIPEKYEPRPPQVVYDMTEPKSGPTPLQATDYKSSIQVPNGAYNVDKNLTGAYYDADKAVKAGLRGAVESTVGKTHGPQGAAELKATNDKLGRILTSKEKQALEAAKEGNKNAVTSLDPLVAMGMGKYAFAAKKAADIAKLTGPRTVMGKKLYQVGGLLKKLPPGMADQVAKEILRQNGQPGLLPQDENEQVPQINFGTNNK